MICRFVEPEVSPGLLDVLWSDPVHDSNVLPPDYDEEAEEEYHKYLEIDWRPNPTRGCSYCFGYAAIVAFLQNNNFICLLRAHEVQETGFHEHFQSVIVTRRVQLTSPRASSASSPPVSGDSVAPGPYTPPSREDPYMCLSKEVVAAGSDNCVYSEMSKCLPLVITVFSAPNYCDRYENKAAILTLGKKLSEFQFIQYDCVEHPVPDDMYNEMNNQIAAVVASCPYMPTSFQDFVRLALELGFEDDLFEEDELSPEDSAPLVGLHSEQIVIHTEDGVDIPLNGLSPSPVPKPILCPDPLTPPESTRMADINEERERGSRIDSKRSASLTVTPFSGQVGHEAPAKRAKPSSPQVATADSTLESAGISTPPPKPSFTSPGRKVSGPSPFLKSKSLHSHGTPGSNTPDPALKNTSPAVSFFQRPPLAKTPSENTVFSPSTSTRRASLASPYSMVQDGYVRQRINSIEALKIEVVKPFNM